MRREQAYIYIYTRWYKGTKRCATLSSPLGWRRTFFPSVSAAKETREREEEREDRDGRRSEEVDISRGENLNKTRGRGGKSSLFHPLFRYRLPLPPTPPHLKKCKFSKWKLVERLGQCEPPPRCPPQHLRIPILFLEFNLFAVQGTLRFVHSRVKDTVMARIPANFDIFFHRDSIRLINQGPRESNSLRWTNLVVGKWFFTSF